MGGGELINIMLYYTIFTLYTYLLEIEIYNDCTFRSAPYPLPDSSAHGSPDVLSFHRYWLSAGRSLEFGHIEHAYSNFDIPARKRHMFAQIHSKSVKLERCW